jgi:hypothetical protein
MTRLKRVFVPVVALVFGVGLFTLSPAGRRGLLAVQRHPEDRDQSQVRIRRHRCVAESPAAVDGALLGRDRTRSFRRNGLVLTNHHIALASLQQLSTPDKDFVKNGFIAQSTAEELKVPGMSLGVLQSIEDVTPKVVVR